MSLGRLDATRGENGPLWSPEVALGSPQSPVRILPAERRRTVHLNGRCAARCTFREVQWRFDKKPSLEYDVGRLYPVDGMQAARGRCALR